MRGSGIKVAAIFVVALATSFVFVGREYVAAVDGFAYRDPTVGFTPSRTSGPSGSVIHLAGAPAGTAVVELSGDAGVAYGPAFVDADGVAAVVPPMFRGTALASGEMDLRLLVRKGPIWASSAKTRFTIEAASETGAPVGMATLFGLEVVRGLLADASATASAAASAGAPSEASQQAGQLAQLETETAALVTQLEAIASGRSTTITRSSLAIDEAGVRLMDQLMTPYFASLGPASPSPCGDAKDAQAKSGLAARTVAAAKSAAALFVRSIIDCDSVQVRHIAARTRAWLSSLAYGVTYALRTIPELPKLAGLLIVTIASWGDVSTDASALWKQYGQGADLRAYIAERNGQLTLGADDELYVSYEVEIGDGATTRRTVRLSEELAAAAEQDTYLSGQIARLREQRAFEEALLGSVEDDGETVRARVAQGLQARQSAPTTPPPTTPTPSPTPAPATAAPSATLAVVSLPPTPAALSYALIAPPSMTAGKAVTFGFCAPRPASATALCGPGSTNPRGGNPPYTFTYSVPRPNGLSFNSNGLVTGTPTASGPFSVEVCVKDLSGTSVCRTVNGTIAAAPTPQPVACAGTAYAGTTWSGPLSVSSNRYATTLTFTFGQPTYFASGCTVPIASVRTSDGSRTWGLNTTYPYNYGSFNRLSCDATACDDFTFTIELQSGAPLCGNCTLPEPPAKLIINTYSATITPTALTGNAGTGSSAGGCCSDGTFNLSKQ